MALTARSDVVASFTEVLMALTARSGKAIAVAIAIRAELPFADRTGANGVTTTADDHVAHVALGFTVEGAGVSSASDRSGQLVQQQSKHSRTIDTRVLGRFL